MNLPAEQPVKTGLVLEEIDFKNELLSLISQKFIGYIVLTIQGLDGFEEGLMVFKEGNVIASTYEYTKFNTFVYGDSALASCFNASAASYGIIDVFALTAEQADLVIAFNEKAKITSMMESQLGKLIKNLPLKEFNKVYALEALKGVKVEKELNKIDLIKRFGLQGIEE